MPHRPQISYKPEHSGHHRDCMVVYFYETTNIRGHILLNNFTDFPIPIPDGNCDCSSGNSESLWTKETAPSLAPQAARVQLNKGPANQLEWLADVALSDRYPLPTPPPSSKPSPKAPSVSLPLDPAPTWSVVRSKLSQRKTPKPTDSVLPSGAPTTRLRRLSSGERTFTFWKYLGMAESMDTPDLHAPIKRQKRKIQNSAEEGSSYYYVWRASDSKV
ncbi:hypothetical protein RhiJN_11404 [Ceratobasidium sp. AG-Ba]|nr:hypothetical protein RhiJN_11404 [Ceratobasidium sp. AG-Ba]QRW12125.1 hypothetical protein RhiLY_11124 [Ceratobasidium sp. AG-Ba]